MILVKKIGTIAFLFLLVCGVIAKAGNDGVPDRPHITPFELSEEQNTCSYTECREWYRAIQKDYADITYFDSIGTGDEGFPIFIFRIYTGRKGQPVKVLVMNNIHPGEPEGADASMLLVREILENPGGKWNSVLDNIDLTIICQYNTDGTMNRSCCSRANQNGPLEMGFRGNGRNLDLNRDFVKCDSKNARAFAQYFTAQNFHLFVDNHTSNGADYQYVLTWFHTRPEKLQPALVPVMAEISNSVKGELLKRNFPTAPYVETWKQVPDSGIVAFWESPRYSTGFAALHHCIGFTVETHMWKPFNERVYATLAFMEELLHKSSHEATSNKIVNAWKASTSPNKIKPQSKEYIQWELNTKQVDSIPFLGYGYSYAVHPLTGQPLLHYDRTKPWKKNIAYFNQYQAIDSVVMPRIYVIPAAWGDIIYRLKLNHIGMTSVPNDTLWKLRASYIVGYESSKTPYEGHYLHSKTTTRDTLIPIQIYSGDVMVFVTESNRKFLAAVLEPRSPDSYFNWGFFDAVLQQKEWYSDYVWADKALEILNEDVKLKKQFELEKARDSAFANSNQAQLSWIYYRSVYYEQTHKRIPVYRMD